MALSRWFASVITTLDIMCLCGFWLMDASARAMTVKPNRTSGMPTLEVLRGAGLKNVCCVVTRYLGGTLFGG